MACNNGHNTCLGVICTIANVPKRPPNSEAARDKRRVFEEIKPLLGHIEKETPTSITGLFWYLSDTLKSIAQIKNILQSQSTWRHKITMTDEKSRTLIKVTLKRIKP